MKTTVVGSGGAEVFRSEDEEVEVVDWMNGGASPPPPPKRNATTTTTMEDDDDKNGMIEEVEDHHETSLMNPIPHPGNNHHHHNTASATTTSNRQAPIFIPNTIEMTLLCMDYLRNQLLRNHHHHHHHRPSSTTNMEEDRTVDGLTSTTTATVLPISSSSSPPQLQYISIAVWALQQSLLVAPTTLSHETTPVALFPDGTDAWTPSQQLPSNGTTSTTTTTTTDIPWPLPNLETIYSQIHYHPVVTHSSKNGVVGVMEEKKVDDPHEEEEDALVVPVGGGDPGNYDDDHSSNLYRCYNHHSGNPETPLSLDHLVTIALLALSSSSSRIHYDTQLLLGNRNNYDHDDDHDPNHNTMTHTSTTSTTTSALFASYLQAVVQKGFFQDCLQPQQTINNSTNTSNADTSDVASSSALYTITNPILYQDKFRKVVTKFRNKCTLVEEIRNDNKGVNHSAYLDYNSILQYLLTSSSSAAVSNNDSTKSNTKMIRTIHGIPIPSLYLPTAPHQQRTVLVAPSLSAAVTNPYANNPYGSSIPPSESMTSYYSVIPPSTSGIMMPNNNNTPSHQQQQQQHPNNSNASIVSQQSQSHPSDIQEAEKYKNLGNTYMQQKLYTKAIECYTTALQYAPLSYNAHVYYSNRAAAYISCKEYANAIRDSERALMIVPTYGKGHARLGLAYFLSSQYRNAVEAYTVALKYDPDNQSSKNYLEKSALRLAEQEQQQQQGPAGDADANGNQNTSRGSASSPALVQSNNSFSVISEMERSNNNNTHHHNHHSVPQTKVGGTQNQHHSMQPPSPSMSTTPSVSSVLHDNINRNIVSTTTSSSHADVSGGNGTVLKEAERYKIKGNTYMSQKDYNSAIQSYTKAIQLLPNDVQKSHVYYSNRAAAFCYLECYHDAEMDAMRAIELVPTYGKAYARLGLSRFLLKNYTGAIRAYETALQYDPDNTASQSYLIKAQQKLLLQQQQQQSSVPTTASVASGTSTRSGLV